MTPLICGNWKLHKTASQAVPFVRELAQRLGQTSSDPREVVVAPAFPALGAVSSALSGSAIGVSGQDCFWEDKGAYTGEVSAPMLRDAGCSYVILGHSERRQYFGETDDMVARKLRAALRSGLAPIVCVGETAQERDQALTKARVGAQLEGALLGLDDQDASTLVVAYEPVWAIGTGRTATAAQAAEVHAFIRTLLERQFPKLGRGVRILYGGSVKPENTAELMAQPHVNGALVGGASLEIDSFCSIVRYKEA